MTEAWHILEIAGVPLGPPNSAAPAKPSAQVLCGALTALKPTDLTNAQADALHAWLEAFSHHWPAQFRQMLGDNGARWLLALRKRGTDANRFLKLRRIAIAELARRY